MFKYFAKVFLIFIFLLSLILVADYSLAQEKSDINIYFFWGKGCPHCAKENEFLDKFEAENPDIKVHRFEVNYNRENSKLLARLGTELGLKTSGVPITLINNGVIYGYLNDETTGKQIENLVNMCREKSCDDPVADIIGDQIEEKEIEVITEAPMSGVPPEEEISKEIPEKIKLPLLGEIEVKSFSLPILTVIIAGLDGFNPCAMWVLLFLISLLLGMKNRRRMWILGISFIVSSALAYFLFLSAWLNLFLFLGFIFWVRIAIGLVAIISGVLHMRSYWTKRKKGCETAVSTDTRRKIFEKLKSLSTNQKFSIALSGIVLIAFAVNIVELVCSAGLPAIYTNILSLSSLPKWQYYLYLLLYIFIFMLDDLLVFFIAMISLRAVGISKKYSLYSSLIGGIIILILGVLLLFRPEWLMFG